jgi:hypothetical protein
MNPLSNDQPRLEPDQAYQRCMQALDPLRPDYAAAQVSATLVLSESVEKLTKEIQLASRR